MPDFGLGTDIEELLDAAVRFAARELAPRVRGSERDGRWSEAVVRVLRDFQLPALDAPDEWGGAGVGGGSRAKVTLLEALAYGDPGGLPAADQPGPAIGACLACPDAA